jgi:L-lactate dehydrogenase (cytochrome)
LVPNILASVGKPDLSTTLFGRKIDMPIFSISSSNAEAISPMTVIKLQLELQKNLDTFYSMSSMGNNTIEEVSEYF